ncbi:MAG: protein kinase [Gemmatimonadaceae bacterium]|nr:protein kinase [Gemmatimonadaceae bacterium]
MDIRPGTRLDGPGGQSITVGPLLGQGGFGQVFAGEMADGTPVAIKTMLTGALSSGELEALQNEGRLAVGIDHPHVVRVLHFDDGLGGAGFPPFLVMERVNGETLADVIERRRLAGDRFSETELRDLFAAIADGMEAVNARLVHRDLAKQCAP